MTAGQRVGVYFVHVVATRRTRADRRFDRLDVIDVNDWLLYVAADSIHGLVVMMEQKTANA